MLVVHRDDDLAFHRHAGFVRRNGDRPGATGQSQEGKQQEQD
jgi:hypothetical protein